MKRLTIPILSIPEVVFFPKTSLPILVSNKNAIAMIHDCIQEGKNLGIAMANSSYTENGKTLSKPFQIATMGVPIIIEEFSNGDLKVLVKGISRIRLEKVVQNLPYLLYEVSLLSDFIQQDNVYFHDHKMLRLTKMLEQWLEKTIPNSKERESFNNELGGISDIVSYIATFMIKDPIMKQMILENRSLSDRISTLATLLPLDSSLSENPLILDAFKKYETLEKNYQMAH